MGSANKESRLWVPQIRIISDRDHNKWFLIWTSQRRLLDDGLWNNYFCCMNPTKKTPLRCNTSTTTIWVQYYHTIASAVLQYYYSVTSLLISQYYNNCTTTRLLQYHNTTQNYSVLCSPDNKHLDYGPTHKDSSVWVPKVRFLSDAMIPQLNYCWGSAYSHKATSQQKLGWVSTAPNTTPFYKGAYHPPAMSPMWGPDRLCVTCHNPFDKWIMVAIVRNSNN
jgi:hypothetical protein